MALILNIETATKVCSVALAKNGEVISFKELREDKFSHAEKLNVFIEEILKETNSSVSDIDAVAVSKGPGSYTGLRIGVSTAKGLCFAQDIPLISIDTTMAMANGCYENGESNCFAAPLIDARRMENFNAIYNEELSEVKTITADVLEEGIYDEFLNEKEVVFFGDGAEKSKEILTHENAKFIELLPSAKWMCSISESKFQKQDFEDVAYFEPFYLKDFIAGKPKKLV